MLWLIDLVGGAILAFIFGAKPWESTTNKARWIRLGTGALAIGIVLGILSHWVYPDLLPLSLASKLVVDFAIVLALLVLTVVLELLGKLW